MAKADLTALEVRTLFSYEASSGQLLRASSGIPAGCTRKDGYVVIGINRYRYLAHRLAWLHVHGAWPIKFLDHINRDKSDNRMENLREVDYEGNAQNRSTWTRKSNSGLPRGVYPSLLKYRSLIMLNGDHVHIGTFDTIEGAEAAYLAAKRSLHPGYVP